MAENIAAEVLRPVIEATVKSVGATMKRQFNYLCCFTSNIATLKDEAEALENTAGDLQVRVNSARDNVQVITREVETWLTKSNHMKDLKKTILDEVPNVESGCLKLRARFSLSKRAKKTADHMEELRGQCNFDVISQPGPSAAMEAVPLGTTFDFKSRKQIEEDIMKILRDRKMNMIGICGMGGLGKTTMAKMIMNRALKDQIVDEVVMAVVSQPVDKLKIQLEIGEPLGMKNLKEETSMVNRVQMLQTRLTAGTKRILLVLDDVWERLVVEELGIPRGCTDCTILLTSRNHDVLRAMEVEKVFGMKVLPKEDAWFLFRETVGTCVDDIGLNSIAKEVVEECKGLPIALSIIGAALKDEKNKGIWKDAVRQLRKANPINIPDFIKDVYNPLKVSYDKLDSQEAKSVFLLCCLFGEDANIPLNYLTYFCMALGIFEGGINNLEEARNGMSALIKMLKSRSLLLDGRNENHVRMHDVIRDVCIFIAKKKGYIGGNDCTWISSFHTTAGERIKLPTNLHLLFLSGDSSELEEKINKFDDSFVEGIRDLQVLFIEKYSLLTSLPPHTTESLRNLRTLVLDSCWKLETISFVGEMVHLEILVCYNCDSIKELPPEMKRLNRLKLLDVSECRNLERISPGIISSLFGLEELKMLESFKKWDSNERENGNASVRELEALTNLRCLEIEIDDPALAAENISLSSKLDRFQVRIGPHQYYHRNPQFYLFNKIMSLTWEGETCVGEWIKMPLIRDAECVNLTGNGANNVDYLAKSENIRWLRLSSCETMKNIGRASMDDATVFPHMEYLMLFYLPQLEEILDGTISSNSFHNLKELTLEHLPVLKQLWKSSSSPVFHNLSSIRILECPKLEEILDGPISSNSFHNLKELKLEDLRALKQLWKSSSSLVFHDLSSISIVNCPKLEEILDGPISSNSFHNLSSIYIVRCDCLRNLGQLSSIAENNCLSQLQTLKISNCEMMEQVFLWNEEDGRRMTKIMFPKLKLVVLYKLPNLVTLCQGIGGIELPLLTEMKIERCPKMKSIVSSEENNCGGSRNAHIIDDYHSPHLFCQPQNVSFDSLKILTIEGNAFYCQKIPVSFFNGLEELTVCGYEGSMSLFTSSIARNFVSLRELSIRKCYEIVEVIKDEGEEGAASGGERPLLFPKLEKLELTDLCKLESFCEWNCDVNCRIMKIDGCSNYMIKIFNLGSNVSFSFHGLEELTISNYEGRMSLFSSSMAANILVSLRKLEISYCDEMVKVIGDEKEEENVVSSVGAQTTTTILFPKLQELKLEWLWKLESFCGWNCDVNCRILEIDGCSNYMIKIFNLGSNVSFSFHRLEKLTISSYEGRMSLFSSSMAANILVSLRKLRIFSCKEMVKVIEDEKEEENVVSSGGAQTTTTILFPKLQVLKLWGLDKLESFCEWKCDVELPSLRKVDIKWCSNMKIFSRGLITPNLESVEIDWNKVLESGEKDLNGALEQRYLARQKKKQKEKEAYDEDEKKEEVEEKQRKTTTNEDEETKSQIEEEQNSKTTNPAVEDGRKGEIEEEQNT